MPAAIRNCYPARQLGPLGFLLAKSIHVIAQVGQSSPLHADESEAIAQALFRELPSSGTSWMFPPKNPLREQYTYGLRRT